MLFMALANITLNDQNDQIFWKWISNGKFSVSSAYNAQFLGAMTNLLTEVPGKAKTEPKCKFFSWLVMHDRELTIDNMTKKNWPCDPFCPLCLCIPETTPHLLTECNYSEAV
jgi:hypothetical protein